MNLSGMTELERRKYFCDRDAVAGMPMMIVQRTDTGELEDWPL